MVVKNGVEGDEYVLPLTSVFKWGAHLFRKARWTLDLEDLVLRVCRTKRFRRLEGISASYKSMTLDGLHDLSHMRSDHSIAIAGTGFAIGRRLGLNESDIHLLVLAGLLHDIGHPIYSHIVDDVIAEKTGGHEAVGREIVRTDEELGAIFRDFGVNVEELIQVIEEQGVLGTIQSFADTLGYLLLDGIGLGCTDFGFREAEELITRGLHSLETRLVFTDARIPQGFLDLRARRYIDYYYNELAQVHASCIISLAREAWELIGDDFPRRASQEQDHWLDTCLPKTESVRIAKAVKNGVAFGYTAFKTREEGERTIPSGCIRVRHVMHNPFRKALEIAVLDSHGRIIPARITTKVVPPPGFLEDYSFDVFLR